MDYIPIYKPDDDTVHIFSGKRIKRGLYVSADGIKIHADINGSANIIRKEFPDAFAKQNDISYAKRTNTWKFEKWYTSKTA